MINGTIAKLGDRGNIKEDSIKVDGIPISKTAIKKIYIALNKPRRVLSEIKKQGDRKTVVDLVALDIYAGFKSQVQP